MRPKKLAGFVGVLLVVMVVVVVVVSRNSKPKQAASKKKLRGFSAARNRCSRCLSGGRFKSQRRALQKLLSGG
jgi:hypothetical protein